MTLHDVADNYSKAISLKDMLSSAETEAALVLLALHLGTDHKEWVMLVLCKAMIQEMYPKGVSTEMAKEASRLEFANYEHSTIGSCVLSLLTQLMSELLTDQGYNILCSDEFQHLMEQK